MSANTILSNSQFLQELSTSLNLLSPTTGITVLNSGNNNIETSVVGNTGTVTLSAELENLSLVSTTVLEVDTFANPFTLNQPVADGYVLSCSTVGALSWVAQTGGDGGITDIQTTNANLTASATADPAVWEIGLSDTLLGLVQVGITNLAITTGISMEAGASGLDMANAPILNAAMSNPFKTAPVADGYVLSSTVAGVLNWVAQGGGGGGITEIQTTNANLTASATADPAIWQIGLNQDLSGLLNVEITNLTVGAGADTGLTMSAGCSGILMNDTALSGADMTNPFNVSPDADGYVLSSTIAGALSWVAQTGGGGGITTINTTNANLTASATGDPAIWEIGLNNTLTIDDLTVGNGNTTGITLAIGSAGLTMNDNPIIGASMQNPFIIAPSADGYVLSSTTAGVLSWIAQGGGGAGITTIQTTNANLTADATADPAIWTIGLNPVVEGLTTLVSEQVSCGLDGSPDTGLNLVAGSGGIFMNACQISQVNYIGNLSTDPSTSVDIFSDWNVGANSWGGEVYLDATGVYIDTNSATKNLYYSPSGDLANYSTEVSYPPSTTPTWAISNAGDATLLTGVFTGADVNETAVRLTSGNLDMGNNEIINVNQLLAYSTAPSPDIKIRSNVNTGAGTFGGELYMDSDGVYLTTDSEANKIWLDNSGNLSGFNTATPFPPITAPQWSIGGEGQASFSNLQTTGTGVSINNGGVLLTNNMVNPFSVQPTVSGQILSCTTGGALSWVANGAGSSTGDLISLGGAYSALTLQQNSPFVYILPSTSFNALAQAGMAYYINLSNFTILNNGSVDSLSVGIYLNGADPLVGGVASSSQTFYTTGSYTTISSILQFSIQSPADTFAIYVGAAGASISTVTGGSYTITGIMP